MASTEIALTLTASTPTSNQKEIFTLQQTNTAIGVELTSSIVHSYNLNISSNNTIQLVELLLRYICNHLGTQNVLQGALFA